MQAIKNKLVTLPFLALFSFGAFFVAPLINTTPVSAGETAECGKGEGGVKTSFDFGCPSDTSGKSKELNKNPIYVVLIFVVNIMAAGVGAVIVGSIIWQSIQYASAGGSADKVKNAKNGIVNAVIALVLFLFMYSLLNFLIPGGIFAQ